MNLDMLYVKLTRPIQFCDFNDGLPPPFLLVYIIAWTVGKAYSAISLLTFIVLLYISIWPNVIPIYYSHGAQTSSKITTPSHLRECWFPKRKFHCYLSWKWTEICFFLSLTGFNHLNYLDTTCFFCLMKKKCKLDCCQPIIISFLVTIFLTLIFSYLFHHGSN